MKFISMLCTVAVILTQLGNFTAFAEEWEAVPMVLEKNLDRGLIGGEGGQHTTAITVSRTVPNFWMAGTDVGGMYRSYDNGDTWEPCNIGFSSRGACSITIDPKNEDHILAVGGNTGVTSMQGIYMSVDGADTWSKSISMSQACATDTRDQICFDPTSYDEKTGMCMRAYYSTPGMGMGRDRSPESVFAPVWVKALYISEDGGASWSKLENTEMCCNADIEVTDDGVLYVGSPDGFFISNDYGKTFEKTLDDYVLSVDYIPTRSDNVYVSSYKKIYISTDRGKSFTQLQSENMPPVYPKEESDKVRFMGYRYFNVSPVNPDHMVIGAGLAEFNWQRWYSRDGGKNWYRGGVEYLGNGIHYSTRNPHNAWSLEDENMLISSGGDWFTKSTDGGKMYRHSSNGESALMAYQSSINIYDPDKMFISAQDYGSFASYDGGLSWSFTTVSGDGRGGMVYDAYIVDDELAFGIAEQPGKLFIRPYGAKLNLTLRVARGYHNLDFEIVEGVDPEEFALYQSPTEPDILFAGVLISKDRGTTWKKMNGCRAVYTHNYNPDGTHELFGVNEKCVVVSYDNGDTWKKIKEIDFVPNSLAYNWKTNKLLVAGYDKHKLYRIDVTTGKLEDLTANVIPGVAGRKIYSVAVDPIEPNIVYIAGAANYALNDASCQRSLDGGNTFDIITRHHPDSVITSGPEGPAESNWISVNPVTREVFVTTQCFGVWKIGAPGTPVQKGEKLYVAKRDNSVYINWFGNGKYDLKDIAHLANISIYNKEHNELEETLYEAFWDGDTVHDEQELDIISYYAFNEWEKEICTYEIYRSTDNENFEKIEVTNDTQYTDSAVQSGVTYYYKVLNLSNGETTVTKTITVN